MKRLKVVYILASKYDDDGYVLRFWRGVLPSNTLSVLKALTQDVADSGALGGDVEMSIETYDDTVHRIPFRRLIRENGREDTQVLVGLVGVQTNQIERATDLMLQFREAGIQVVVGGFHVSGMLAMFDTPSPELRRLLDHGVSLVKGEAEAPGALAGILRDALNGEMKPIYDIKDAPDLRSARIPMPDPEYMKHFTCSSMATVDTSRGCPFDCSFCTIINVQGRRMRHRDAAPILEAIEKSYANGVRIYFFTDDNFSRSPVWEDVFDGLTAIRARGIDVRFMMQIDTQAYRIPGFVERAREAGCYLVFVGMESVNPDNLEAVGKRQNDVEAYAKMVDTWHDAEIIVHVGYIIGMPYDTAESIRLDIETLKNQIRVDQASFFMLTPLPGSRDHQRMVDEGVPMEADLNNFDSLHETYRHPKMSPGTWQRAFGEAWQSFYSKEHVTNIMLRTPRSRYWTMFWTLMYCRFSVLAGLHPMFTGQIRLKGRRDRRALFAREDLARYTWRRMHDFAWIARTYARLFFEFQEIWLLTRKRDDPRWATLAELRTSWADVQQRIYESDLRGRCDQAVREVRDMLAATSERLTRLSASPKKLNARARRRLRALARETDSYLRSFEVQIPTWESVVKAQQHVTECVIGRYEDLAIRHVAARRRFNAYRRDLVERCKSWRFLTMNITTIPRALLFEVVIGLRFGMSFLFHA
jgi:radical SAM superfamily enzyme YgiQ (UPF0313 family)